MTVGDPAGLLSLWEQGLADPGPGRALVLHRAARPGTADEELLAMRVGGREADLYGLRRALFGDRMEVLAECVECSAAMEFSLDAEALAAESAAGGSAAGGSAGRGAARAGSAAHGESVGSVLVAEDGWEVSLRPPTGGDLAAAAATGDPELARTALVERCVVSVAHEGRPVAAAELPERVRSAVAEAAREADPAAEVSLRVACPECGAANDAELDIAGHLWTELDTRARELLLDVHLLARAYGWSEPEILALSPSRRRHYLELCLDA